MDPEAEPVRTADRIGDRGDIGSPGRCGGAGRVDLAARASAVRERAAALAGPLASRARASTSLACERAALRLVGVGGLAPNGRPLAMDVAERFLGAGRRAFALGIGLPFALAAVEYDLEPQALALDVSLGHIDLAAEAQLLADPVRRDEATATLERWRSAVFQRFDANRTARRELVDVLGEAREPWLGTELRSYDAGEAASQAARLVADGGDLFLVRVPLDAEWRSGRREATDEPDWPSGPAAPPPAGSQRGLALIRARLDESAMRHGRYPRLATRWIGLATPEQAVVAGFERVDVVFSDPLEAIFGLGVDPDRAFVDHSLAQRLLVRVGARLVLGPGPLVTPPGERWEDVDHPARAGRALALQALGRSFAVANGIDPQRIDLGAVPASTYVGSDWPVRAQVDVALRGGMYPEHRLVVDEPPPDMGDEVLAYALFAWAAGGARFRACMSPASPSQFADAGRATRGALAAAGWLVEARTIGDLRGAARDHAEASLDAAEGLLGRLEREGFNVLVGEDPAAHVGADGRVERPDDASRFAAGSPDHLLSSG
jgi:hypothetical protein